MTNKKMTFYLVFVTLLALLLNLGLMFAVFDLSPLLHSLALEPIVVVYVLLSLALAGGIGAFVFSALIARWMLGVTLIQQPGTYLEKWLFASVERQSRQLGIPMPQIGVFYATDMNAFTAGWHTRRAMFAVSSGLLENLAEDELEAVIGHELAHIENGDMMSLAIARGMVVSITELPARLFGYLFDYLILRGKSRGGPAYQLVYWSCMLSMGLLPHFVVMGFSRAREYAADKTSAMLNGGEKMIYALQRLFNNHHYHQQQQTAISLGSAVLEGLVEEFGHLKAIFSSHPPLHKRIQMIQQDLDNNNKSTQVSL